MSLKSPATKIVLSGAMHSGKSYFLDTLKNNPLFNIERSRYNLDVEVHITRKHLDGCGEMTDRQRQEILIMNSLIQRQSYASNGITPAITDRGSLDYIAWASQKHPENPYDINMYLERCLDINSIRQSEVPCDVYVLVPSVVDYGLMSSKRKGFLNEISPTGTGYSSLYHDSVNRNTAVQQAINAVDARVMQYCMYTDTPFIDLRSGRYPQNVYDTMNIDKPYAWQDIFRYYMESVCSIEELIEEYASVNFITCGELDESSLSTKRESS